MTTVQLGSANAKHRYDVEVTQLAPGLTYDTNTGEEKVAYFFNTISVDANDRNQAARIAEKAGYTVRSVNMVG